MFRLERQNWELQEQRGYLKLQEWVSWPRERLCPWGKGQAHGFPTWGNKQRKRLQSR